MTTPSPTDSPNRVPWPPLLLVVAILVGLLLHYLVPLDLPDLPFTRVVGTILIIVALALDVWAFLIFRRARTTILPHRGSDALVTSGPFSWSRNPIYVGNVLILIGIGLRAQSFWPLLLAPVLAFAVQKLAIEREEAHLSARFGAQWDDYTARVRRWL